MITALQGLIHAAGVFLAFAVAPVPLAAEPASYQVLRQFHPNAVAPSGLIQARDGNFYGTTQIGGVTGAGRVFKITSSGVVTTLHSFTGPDGVRPQAALVEAIDGNFYGATNRGGANGVGTIFRITPSGTFTTLHSFAGGDGAHPQFDRWIQISDGTFYGTTIQGGTANLGTIFKMDSAGTVTMLHSFRGSDGSYPSAGIVKGSDGNFYGTTALGGTSGRGTVFKMDPTGAVTTLHSFIGSDGSYPEAELLQASDGNFYGTTPSGGTANVALNRGTVFRISPSGVFTSLHSFVQIDGLSPSAGLIAGSDGNFYGTTNQGGTASRGTIFRMDSAGKVTSVHSFADSEGWNPSAGLILASDGNYYGATDAGGAEKDGTIFKMDSSGSVTTIYSFTGRDGFLPNGGLIQANDGNFYGTTNVGGANDAGSVYRMDTAGTLTTIFSFSGSDGLFPNHCRLVQGNDGNFYGTTSSGGNVSGSGYGTVFKLTPSGAFTSLHSFHVIDGASPSAGLTKGSDGNFYGLTFDGGANSAGSVYRITPTGTLTTLHFFNGTDGSLPFGTVIEGSDGNFYGTTNKGGAHGAGTIFKLDPTGAVTTLHSFAGPDGSQPYGGLVQGRDGAFYGMTTVGGEGHDASSGHGTAFRITPSGVFTRIHTFAGTDGSTPFGELTLGSDGNFYGTTNRGGATYNAATFQFGSGTVFRMTPAGEVTTLHSFTTTDGAGPLSGPVQLSDGSFVGTTGGGGLNYVGVAYHLVPHAAPAAPMIGIATPGDGQAIIAFTAPVNDGGSPVTGYAVTCNPTDKSATGADSPITVTGLANGTTYTCSVTATNAIGTSAPSATVSVTPVAEVVLAALEASVQTGQAPLTVTFTVSGTPPPGKNLQSYSLVFGDGESLLNQPFGGVTAVQTTHAYTSPGNFSASLTVTDNGGRTSSNVAARTVVVNAPDVPARPADLNVDGAVDSQDLVIMASYLVGNMTPGTPPFSAPLGASDLNQDNRVDVVDVVILANYLVGNIGGLPAN